jgi:hypothetical protein
VDIANESIRLSRLSSGQFLEDLNFLVVNLKLLITFTSGIHPMPAFDGRALHFILVPRVTTQGNRHHAA